MCGDIVGGGVDGGNDKLRKYLISYKYSCTLSYLLHWREKITTWHLPHTIVESRAHGVSFSGWQEDEREQEKVCDSQTKK